MMKILERLCILFLALIISPLVANATISDPCSLTTYDGSGNFPADPDSASLTKVALRGGETFTFPTGTEAVFLEISGLESQLPILVTEATGAFCSVSLMPSGTGGSLYLALVDAKGIAQIVLPGGGSVSFSLSYGRIFPVADAGTDRKVPALRRVLLDASTSSDPDPIATLQYAWNLIELPPGSQALLSNPFVATPSFVPDILGDYVLELVVTDGHGLESMPVMVRITATNPEAEAGDDQTVPVDSLVTLDGCHSSDAEPDSLTYSWSIADAPIESGLFLTGSDTCAPTFVADLPGPYVFELLVRDRFGVEGIPDTVRITVTPSNAQPTAEAGSAQTVHVGTLAMLDGTASSDPDGNPITYVWKFLSRPAGSTAALSGATTATPTFRPDLQGSYDVELVVTDNSSLQSLPDTVTINTSNSPPKADAGPDQAITAIGTVVNLDGGQSHDPDKDDLTYAWVLVSRPPESSAKLTGASSAQASFVADVHGDYTLRLVVRDPWTASDPDMVIVSFNNVKPVAAIVSSKSGVVDDPVTLDGSTSSDANGDALTYLWSLISFPPGSTSRIVDPTAEVAAFTPDRPGTYVAQLIVNDGFESSNRSAANTASTATIQVVSEKTATVMAIQELQNKITLLEPRAFRQPMMKRLLNLELNLVLAAVERGRYRTALTLLINGVLPTTDGCAVRGAPDRQDWIVDCAAQRAVYPELQEIIAMLREML